jgi:hypothetical protein
MNRSMTVWARCQDFYCMRGPRHTSVRNWNVYAAYRKARGVGADSVNYTVTTQRNAEHPRIQAFINWIEEQVEREQRRPDQAS